MTLALFAAFFLFLAAQRLWEVRVSARHETALRKRGAIEVAGDRFSFLAAVQVIWLVGMALEVGILGARPWAGSLACLGIFLAAEALRTWARSTLGERWTVRVLVLPGEPLVTRGPYRWLRHPNYLAVALQMAAAPLVFGAWRTALVGLGLYTVALGLRLRVEEPALRSVESRSIRPRAPEPPADSA